MSSCSQFLQRCSALTNCNVVCRKNEILQTHKIVLALCGDFLKNLLLDAPVEENVTIFLPDFEKKDLEDLIERKLTRTESKPCDLEYLLNPSKMHYQKLTNSDEEPSVKAEEDIKTLPCKTKDETENSTQKIPKLKHSLPIKKTDYEPRNVDLDKLKEKIIPDARSRQDIKHNEIIEKQILHEKAIAAYVNGDSSLNQIGKEFGVKKSTLYKLLKCDKKFSGKGNKSSLFTEDEEKLITEKALSLVNDGKDINLGILRELLTEELRSLKAANPDRKIAVGLSSQDAVINKSFVRRFAIRNKLEKFMFQKYVLSEKRVFECDICSKSFTLKCSLATHQKQIHFSFLQTNDALGNPF